ncbi:MAG: hypothetical protein Kow0032_22070 [Methyloligellaceae bacterium]
MTQTLLRHVFLGFPFLVNDGYIAHSETLREKVFGYTDNPLRTLFLEGYAILSSPDADLVESLEIRRRSNVESTLKLMDRSDWRDIRARIERFNRQVEGFTKLWPNKDMGKGLEMMLERCRGRPAKQIGLEHTTDDEITRIFDIFFDRRRYRKFKGARTRFEKVVADFVAGLDAVDSEAKKKKANELMGLANEAYHFNFGIAYSAELPEVVAVETQQSPAFDEFLDIPGADLNTLRGMPDLYVPDRIALNNGDILREVCDETSELHEYKARYIDMQKEYILGNVNRDFYEASVKSYSEALSKRLGASLDLSRSTNVVSWFVFGSNVAASFAGTAAGLGYGGVAFLSEKFGLPHILRKIAVRSMERDLRREMGPVYRDRLSSEQLLKYSIASASLGKQKARDLADKIPDLH